MPTTLVLIVLAVMVILVIGFFALMFNEMRIKRNTGRTTGAHIERGGSDKSKRAGRGKGKGKPRQRKSR
jgi:hypothetical protein